MGANALDYEENPESISEVERAVDVGENARGCGTSAVFICLFAMIPLEEKMKRIFLILLATLCFGRASYADGTIGSKTLTLSNVPANTQIITSAMNTNGIYIRTITVACAFQDEFSVVAPGSTSLITIFGCSPPAVNQVNTASLWSSLYLPPGYTLVSGNVTNGIVITYDAVQ